MEVVLKMCRYDYLEFTDARGGKVRYDTKIGTEKWPKVGSHIQRSCLKDHFITEGVVIEYIRCHGPCTHTLLFWCFVCSIRR